MSDRPLHRRLVKLAFALAPGRAHAQEAWPGLSLTRPSGAERGEVRWRGRALAPLLPLAELPRAATVSVVGSGPSMEGVDPASLPGLPILLNGAVTLAPRLGRPAMLAIEDERFVWRRFGLVREALPEGAVCLFSVAVLRAVAERDAAWLARHEVFLLDNLLKPYGARRRAVDAPELADVIVGIRDGAVSRDPAAGVVIAGTVALSATQVALALAGERVALAGVDLTNAAAPRFYERSGDVAPSGLAAGQARILAGFAAARALARERGLRLETVTPGSALAAVGVPFAPL